MIMNPVGFAYRVFLFKLVLREGIYPNQHKIFDLFKLFRPLMSGCVYQTEF